MSGVVPVGVRAVAALAEIAAREEVGSEEAAELAIAAYRDGMRGLRGCVDVVLVLGGFDVEVEVSPVDARNGPMVTLRSGDVAVEIGTVDGVATVADLAAVDVLIGRLRELRAALTARVAGSGSW